MIIRPANPPPERRHGVWMFVFGFALALFVLVYFFEGVLAARDNPNTLAVLAKQSGELRLKKNAGGHYLAAGRIGGLPVTFLVDTGATRVALSPAMARRAGLQAGGEGRAQTAAGIARTYHTTISDMQVGSLLFSDVRALIVEDMADDSALLGMNVLAHLQMSQEGDTLILRPKAARQ